MCRVARPPSAGSQAYLIAVAWIGALSHLLLDAFSGARVQPGWPLLNARLSIPLFAMAVARHPLERRGVAITPLFPRRQPRAAYVTLAEAVPLGLRVTEEDEVAGLDLSQHSETAYALGGGSYGEYASGGGAFAEAMRAAEVKPRPAH